jgi:histidinol phosphatase-like enzyme (inositol monophosphatase family)
VTIADRETEAALREAISARFPDHGIFGEEYGSEGLERDIVWVIDPIDGTKSFISGSPLFGMLVAVLQGGRPVAGIIRMPALGECYAGAAGCGSDRDGTPVSCRQGVRPENAFLCINEANGLMADHPAVFRRLMRTGAYQRLSYDCYPYAQLAGGQIDAVVDYNLQPYDYLPVVPVVEGAGGIITDWRGEALTLESDGRVIAAASAEIHRALLETVAE